MTETATAERLPDCTVLDALCTEHVHLHTSIADYLAVLNQHAESDCAQCAAIARADQFAELEAEPQCSCHQTDVDLFDAAGCDVHDSNSPWNVRLRAVTSVQIYEGMVAA